MHKDCTLTPVQLSRFWKYVRKSEGCWEWSGDIISGYGRFTLQHSPKRIRVRAHRTSYVIHFGNIADDICVCHHCDNPRCVNPEHLFLGTRRDNHEDMVRKGRAAYPASHPLPRRFSQEVRQSICDRYEAGETQTSIAKDLGCGQSFIAMIIKRDNPELAARMRAARK